MRLAKLFARSEKWLIGSAAITNGMSFPTTNRSRIGFALIQLSNEHYHSIHTLIENGLLGSAMALFRPQYETTVRGLWFLLCASEQQIRKFIDGKDPPKIGEMVMAIEKVKRYDTGTLSKLHNGLWKYLHDYTHGGINQVKNRLAENEIKPPEDEDKMAGVLEGSMVLAWLASNEITIQANDKERCIRLRNLYKEFENSVV